MSEKPEVVQSDLDIQTSEVTTVKPEKLSPHPRNEKIYGDTGELEETFLESVKEKGVLEPLVVNRQHKIISGHRRWKAAKQTGVNQIPVRVADFESELEEREALIEFNRQREKTPGQIINEYEEIKAIEEEKAKQRQGHGQTAPGKNASGNVSTSEESGVARDRAAENFDYSGRTLDKGLKVKEKAEQGDETAQKQWEKLEKGDTSFNKAHRTVKREEKKEELENKTPELPEDEYEIILADPPWNYNFSPTDNRKVENHYPTMEIEDIKQLDVPAAENSVLYLWTTAPKLKEGIEVLESWGFKYTTSMVWVKDKIGMGYWARNRHEYLLIGKKGSFSPPEEGNRPESVIEAPRTEHSSKPEEIYDIIESNFPKSKKIEMFARKKPGDNWRVWGNEVE